MCLLAHAEGRLKFSGLWDREDINQSLVHKQFIPSDQWRQAGQLIPCEEKNGNLEGLCLALL